MMKEKITENEMKYYKLMIRLHLILSNTNYRVVEYSIMATKSEFLIKVVRNFDNVIRKFEFDIAPHRQLQTDVKTHRSKISLEATSYYERRQEREIDRCLKSITNYAVSGQKLPFKTNDQGKRVYICSK